MTNIVSGAGLTGGPITTSGTLSIAPGGVTNAMLANPSLTVNAGTGLSGGGSVPLGGTLNLTNTGVLSVGTSAGSGILGGTAANPTVSADTTVLATENSVTSAVGIETSRAEGAESSLQSNINTVTGSTLTLTASSPLTGGGTFNPGTNASLTFGLNTSSLAQLGSANTFTADQTLAGGGLLPATGTATSVAPFQSSPLDFVASSWNGSSAVNQLFRWQAEGNGSSATGSLSLLYLSGSGTPAETGLSINNAGVITFASGQTFPGTSGIMGVTTASGSGLLGGGTSGTLNLSADHSVVAFLTDVSTETARAETAESNLQSSLASETTRAEGAESTLTGNLSAETSRAETAEANLLPLSGGVLTGGLTGTTAAFSGMVSTGGTLLPATASATASSGAASGPLDLRASSFNVGINQAVNQDFRWVAEPAGNDSGAPSATLNLQFGSGTSAPSETGLFIAANGVINFSPSQTFPTSQLPPASASSQGVLQLSKDLAGTAASPLVAGLQGHPISNVAPTANQILSWNGTAWAPTTAPTNGISGSGTSGTVPEWGGTTSLISSPITDAGGSLTSTEPLTVPSLNTNGQGAGLIQLSVGTTSVTWTLGAGAPTGRCSVGSFFSRTDGGPGSTMYVCEGPSGTWTAK